MRVDMQKLKEVVWHETERGKEFRAWLDSTFKPCSGMLIRYPLRFSEGYGTYRVMYIIEKLNQAQISRERMSDMADIVHGKEVLDIVPQELEKATIIWDDETTLLRALVQYLEGFSGICNVVLQKQVRANKFVWNRENSIPLKDSYSKTVVSHYFMWLVTDDDDRWVVDENEFTSGSLEHVFWQVRQHLEQLNFTSESKDGE